MRKTLMKCTFVLSITASAAHADDCAVLGLSNDYLQDHFCMQLQGLGQSTGTTRSIVQEGDPDADESAIAEWLSIGLIQDAYRADPRKTLELIERIKGAGGLSAEITN